MHIPHPQAQTLHVVRQVLRHALGEGGHQGPLVSPDPQADLVHQVVDLPLHGAHLHPGIQQARGPDHLLGHLVGVLTLIVPGSGGHKHRLVIPLLKFRKFQGPVVEGAGQAEAVFHQALLPGPVAVVHGPDLGQGHMALVHKQQKILREIVQQGGGRGAGLPAGDDPGIVFDAGAIAQLPHHLQVIPGALVNALGLDELAMILKPLFPLRQLLFDLRCRPLHLVLGGDVVAGGVDGHMLEHSLGLTGDGVDLGNAVDLVAEELHPDGVAVGVHRIDLHRVPPDPEHVPVKGDVVAFIADFHQLAQQLIPGILLSLTQGDHHVGVVDGVPQSIDARHR